MVVLAKQQGGGRLLAASETKTGNLLVELFVLYKLELPVYKIKDTRHSVKKVEIRHKREMLMTMINIKGL